MGNGIRDDPITNSRMEAERKIFMVLQKVNAKRQITMAKLCDFTIIPNKF